MLRGSTEAILYKASDGGNIAASLEKMREDCPGERLERGTLRAVQVNTGCCPFSHREGDTAAAISRPLP